MFWALGCPLPSVTVNNSINSTSLGFLSCQPARVILILGCYVNKQDNVYKALGAVPRTFKHPTKWQEPLGSPFGKWIACVLHSTSLGVVKWPILWKWLESTFWSWGHRARPANLPTVYMCVCVYIYGRVYIHVYTYTSIYAYIHTPLICAFSFFVGSHFTMPLFKWANPSLFTSLQVNYFSDDDVTQNVEKLEAFYIIRGQWLGLFHPVLHLRALCSGFRIISACLSQPGPSSCPWALCYWPMNFTLTHHHSHGAEFQEG